MFEKLKQRLLERIERDAVKSECTYTPVEFLSGKKGDPITETVYMKRSKMPLTGDWQRIYPPVNEDGSWNVINVIFGGKKNLIRLIGVGAIVAMVLLGFNELFNYIGVLKETCIQPILIG